MTLKTGLGLMHLFYVNMIKIKKMLSFLACPGTDGMWITKNDLPRFTGCKIVEGNLDIYNQSFTM